MLLTSEQSLQPVHQWVSETKSHYLVQTDLEITTYTRLASNFLQVSCLCLPRAGIIGMCKPPHPRLALWLLVAVGVLRQILTVQIRLLGTRCVSRAGFDL